MPRFAANLTIVILLSQTIAAPAGGHIADKVGNKWLIEICTLLNMIGVLLVLAAPTDVWFYGVFIVISAAGAGMGIASSNLTLEFSDEVETYTALADTMLAVPVLLSPILGGWLVDWAGFRATFLIGMALYAAGWMILHWFVQDPRHITN